MRILIIGYGSIAERHIRNLISIIHDRKESLEIFLVRSGRGREVDLDIKPHIKDIYSEKEKIPGFYDAVFITNPTSLHYETLRKYHDVSNNFFVEKPVFLTGTEDIAFFEGTGKNYYVACPLRYTNIIQWLKSNIDFNAVRSIRAISSSYLPDWRPGTDYRESYSAKKVLGGGVSIDLIHEWDYLTYLIGFPQNVKHFISKKSSLEIDSDDIAIYIAEYADKLVELHLDYFGRKPVRMIELYMDKDTVVADLINQKLCWLCTGREIDLSEDRDSYQKKELLHFLYIISGGMESDNGIEDACRVLRLARGLK